MAGGGYPYGQPQYPPQFGQTAPPPQYSQSAPPPQHGHHAPPRGELVTVYTQANPNYRVTLRQEGAVLTFKNSQDPAQQWIKISVGPGHGEFIDREGQPGFILINKANGLPLKHGNFANEAVTPDRDVYAANSQLKGSLIWTLGAKDEGHGFKGMRSLTNVSLNLEAEHADKKHGGVREGNRLVMSPWTALENVKWKVEPLVED